MDYYRERLGPPEGYAPPPLPGGLDQYDPHGSARSNPGSGQFLVDQRTVSSEALRR